MKPTVIIIPMSEFTTYLDRNSFITEKMRKLIMASSVEATLMIYVDGIAKVDAILYTTSWTSMAEYCQDKNERVGVRKLLIRFTSIIGGYLLKSNIKPSTGTYPRVEIKPRHIKLVYGDSCQKVN